MKPAADSAARSHIPHWPMHDSIVTFGFSLPSVRGGNSATRRDRSTIRSPTPTPGTSAASDFARADSIIGCCVRPRNFFGIAELFSQHFREPAVFTDPIGLKSPFRAVLQNEAALADR